MPVNAFTLCSVGIAVQAVKSQYAIPLHSEKADAPIIAGLPGIVIDASDLHCKKAFAPILEMLPWIVILARQSQYWHRPLGIAVMAESRDNSLIPFKFPYVTEPIDVIPLVRILVIFVV